MTRKKKHRRSTGSTHRPASSTKSLRPEKGKEVLEEKVIRSGQIKEVTVDDFVETGRSCPLCGFQTTKTGRAGLQSFRAHWKRHIRDRRARVRPILKQLGLLLAAIVLAIVPSFVAVEIPAAIDSSIRSGLSAANYVGSVFGVVCAVSALLVATSWHLFRTTGRRKWRRRYLVTVIWSNVLLFTTAATSLLGADEMIRRTWLLSGLLPWLMSASTGFCQNSELDTRFCRPKYRLDHNIHAANSVIRADHLPVKISLRPEAAMGSSSTDLTLR